MKKEYNRQTIEKCARNCLLCHNASCDAACPHKLQPSKFLRSIYFDNYINAGNFINKKLCSKCKGQCEKKCISNSPNQIHLWDLINSYQTIKVDTKDVDLSIKFLNKKCENPFFLASSAVVTNYEMCRKALAMGWAGVVFKTICYEECNETSPRFTASKKDGGFISLQNLEQLSENTVEENLKIITKLKKEFPNKIIVASIMGQNPKEWTQLAKLVTKAGCDIIECNFSCPQMTMPNMGHAISANIPLAIEFTKATIKGTKLPIIIKLSPNIGHIESLATAVIKAGAKAISAINTVSSISSIDLDNMQANPNVDGKSSISGLSGKAVKPIALHFIANLSQCKDLKNVDISGIGGIETWRDAAEFISLGCKNVQVCTAVMLYGYRIIEDLISGLKIYLKLHNYKKLDQLVGKAIKNIVPPEKLNRSTICFPQFNWNKCIKCGRCYIACYDAGRQAIEMEGQNIKYNAKKCIGCHLCRLVCPINAIGTAGRIDKKLLVKK